MRRLGEHLSDKPVPLDLVGLGRFDRAVEIRTRVYPCHGVAEQSVFSGNDEGTDCILGEIVVDTQVTAL